MTTLLMRMRGLSAAEEFFSLLRVPYEPQVLNVARLHILRRMAEYLADSALESMTDDAAEEACRAALTHAYADFVASPPIEQRTFKVLKQAVAPRSQGFVPLSALVAESET
ncbi:Nitrogenase-stabilizing/protective protein NifW [Rhodovastum atsumiense]|nr:nitrogenase stabilizing/protective protein NifW [Rhodovastum atsumiense]CAH2599520.1 Nitrogenase-stabilizing/protective protein NifW [Rhodovastum atsumiense]